MARTTSKESLMPAKSKKQQRFMAICSHDPKHAQGKCPSQKISREFSFGKGLK